MNSCTKRPVCYQYYDSPCGKIVLASVGEELCLCDWSGMPCAPKNRQRLVRLLDAVLQEEPSEVILRAESQLDEYFSGRRTAFQIPLCLVGTDFQKRVWNVLLEIPYGQTRTYRDIALRIGNAKGARAVAGAIGANGISVIIPCHRVIGSDRSLTGFAGGLAAKRTLLELENRTSPPLFAM